MMTATEVRERIAEWEQRSLHAWDDIFLPIVVASSRRLVRLLAQESECAAMNAAWLDFMFSGANDGTG